MNEGYFGMTAFKTMMLRLMKAHDGKDGVALQKLESEIIGTYKVTTMSSRQYATLLGICYELLEDWRMNGK